MKDTNTGTRVGRRLSVSLVATIALLALTAGAAIAAASFVDVSDDNIFSGDIEWMADNGITAGCNPPENTRFCPTDEVTRAQMAAFMHRLATNQVVNAAALAGHTSDEFVLKSESGDGSVDHADTADYADEAGHADTADNAAQLDGQNVDDLVDAAVAEALADVGSDSTQITDTLDSIGVQTTDWEELLSVDIAATGEVDVVLSTHVYLERTLTDEGRYGVKISANSCTDTAVGSTLWRPDDSDINFRGDTVTITAGDTTTGTTTYVLCANKGVALAPDVVADQRGMTATWAPSS